MLRRSIVVFSILAILISVCIPAFAAAQEVNIMDYATISVDGITKVVTISLPTDWLQVAICDGGYEVKYSQSGSVTGFDLTDTDFASGGMKVVFAPLGEARNPYLQTLYSGKYLNLEQIPVGSVLHYSVGVEMQAASGQSLSFGTSNFNHFTFQFISGQAYVREPVVTSVPTYIDGYMYSSEYDYTVEDNTKPFAFQHFMSISSSAPSSRWIFRLDELTITTTIDALEQLEKNTGETNRLLEEVNKKLDEITDRTPDPVEPTWGESAGDAEEKEDQIIDQLDPDQVTNDLADMHLTLADNLLLYSNAFYAISAIWILITDLPFIKIILYCSLLFGLLAAFLGMGLAAGRASDRHSGRSSGKKGK